MPKRNWRRTAHKTKTGHKWSYVGTTRSSSYGRSWFMDDVALYRCDRCGLEKRFKNPDVNVDPDRALAKNERNCDKYLVQTVLEA